MARYLTRELYEQYYGRKTSFGADIDYCIQAGVDNHDKISCGIIAADEECYDVFSDLFDPVITDRHRGYTRNNMGYGRKLYSMKGNKVNANPFDPEYVNSIHFLIGRCLHGFRFPPSCGRAERYHVEDLLKISLQSLQGQFTGTYLHLNQLTPKDLETIPEILQSVAEYPTSGTMRKSGSTRDWPCGRGIFYSEDGKLFAWTNREDHLRVMYRVREKEQMLDFTESFRTFCKAMNQLELILRANGIQFAYHDSYGYLLTCPSGIGTALRAGARMKLPRLIKDPRFRLILKNLRLHMGAEDQDFFHNGYIDVYNMDRLGFQEGDLVQHVATSIHILVEMEKGLEAGKDISDLISSNEILYERNHNVA